MVQLYQTKMLTFGLFPEMAGCGSMASSCVVVASAAGVLTR